MPLLQSNSINETKSKLDYIVCANDKKQNREVHFAPDKQLFKTKT